MEQWMITTALEILLYGTAFIFAIMVAFYAFIALSYASWRLLYNITVQQVNGQHGLRNRLSEYKLILKSMFRITKHE